MPRELGDQSDDELQASSPAARRPGWRRLATAAAALVGAALSLGVLLQSPAVGPLRPAPAAAGPLAVLDGAYPLASLRVMSECVHKLRTHFLDPDRIRPREMIARAIEALQGEVVELLVEREGDGADGPDGLVVRMDDTERRFDLRSVADPDRMLWVLMDIFQFLDAHLPPDAPREDIESRATNGLLHTLDPHTTWLDPATYRDMQVETSGKFGGLGIVISVYKGKLTVISVMDETPAAKAGLEPRDNIMQIDDESTINMDLSAAVSRLRGKPGTPVTIHVLRKGWQTPRPYTVVRDRIVIRSVVSKLLDGTLGYVRLKNFRANTANQLALHVERIEGEAGGALKGLILDLRGDPGGFLEQAIRVSDFFLEKGEIVRTIGSGGKVRDSRSARKGDASRGGPTLQTDPEAVPLVVLVDGASASASEIVAGALKNRGRAAIVGSTTFGKGTVQGIYDVGDGAVKITIAEYLTPGGVPVHELGIVPHLQLQPMHIRKDDLRIAQAPDDDEEDDEGGARRRAQSDKPLRVLRHVVEDLTDPDDEEAADARRFEYDEIKEEDFALDVAQALLRDGGHAQSATMLRRARAALDALQEKQLRALEAALGRRGVDWSPGPRQARARVEATILTHPPGGVVPGGDPLTLTVQLRNTGTQTLHRVHAVARSTTRLAAGREFLFGKLAPGQQRQWSAELQPDLSAFGRHDPVTVEFFQDGEPMSLERRTVIGVEEAPRPEFQFSYFVDDAEAGNGDGRVQLGEEVAVVLRVHNVGKATAAETNLALKSLAGEGVFLKDGRRADREPFEPGAVRTVRFTFEVRPGLSHTTLPFEVILHAPKHAVWVSQRIELPVHGSSSAVGERADEVRAVAASTVGRSGASVRFPEVARLERGARVRVDRRAGAWARVAIGGGIGAWVPTADLGDEDGGEAQAVDAAPPSFRPPLVRVQQPVGAERLVEGPRVVLRGESVFHRAGAPLDRSVTVWLGRRKVWFDTRRHVDADPLVIPLDVPLDLEPGPNRVTIRVAEEDRVERSHTFFVHRADDPAANGAATTP